MKIGINGQLLAFSKNYRTAGISRYIKCLLDEYHKYNMNVTLFAASPEARQLYAKFEVLVSDTANPSKRIFWEQFISPFSLVKHKIETYHCPMQVLPLLTRLSRVKKIVTVHDLANFKFPEFYLKSKQKYLTALTRLSMQFADKIIAVSENTKKDLIEVLNVPEKKIQVIYHGCSSLPVDEETALQVKKQYKLPEEYILFVGTLEPRKNIAVLVEALKYLKNTKKTDYPLVIAGAVGWKFSPSFEQIKQSGLKIILTDFLNDEQLAALYKSAKIFVYPSLYEGFGFPVLEAMAKGTPVICSNNSALPEVGGDAGLYFSPEDFHELAEKIQALWSDTKLQYKLSSAGLKQAEKFSWSKCAKQTLELYAG